MVALRFTAKNEVKHPSHDEKNVLTFHLPLGTFQHHSLVFITHIFISNVIIQIFSPLYPVQEDIR